MCSVILLEHLHHELMRLVNLNTDMATALEKRLSNIDESIKDIKKKMDLELMAKDMVIDELQKMNGEQEEHIKHLEDRLDALENFVIDITSASTIGTRMFSP